MKGPLVDAEDYPRSDIDLYKIRDARHQINCLQNDLNTLVKEISAGLEQHFSELKMTEDMGSLSQPSALATTSTSSPEAITLPLNKEPFAVVDAVTDGSPAQEAGLQAKDELLEFGSLNIKNFQNLQQFADIAQHKLNQRVSVIVRRKRNNENSYETIQLIPKKWSGRGHLGMIVKPINKM